MIDVKQADVKKLTLIPIHSGDWEREKDKIMSNITLKRFGCGSDHLGTQIMKFWSAYETHTHGISSDTPISEILRRFIVYVQKHLVFLNYLYCNTFTWGYLDKETMSAIKRCKTEYESAEVTSEDGTLEPRPRTTTTATSVPTSSTVSPLPEEGYLTPQVITFLASQVQIVVKSMKSAGVGSGNKDISRMLRLENAKLSSSRIKHYKNEGMLNWISFLKSGLGLDINRSIVSQYSSLISGLKTVAKEVVASTKDDKDSVASSSIVDDDDNDDDTKSTESRDVVVVEGEVTKEKSRSKKKKSSTKSGSKKKKVEEYYGSDDDDDDDDEKSEFGTRDEVIAALRRELEAERTKYGRLEKSMKKLEADEEQLRNDWTEMQTNYTKLQQQYWLLIYEAEERTKQMNELRQASSISNTRLLRELAKANELLNANKYSIQSNTQRINRIDNSFREVEKKNKGLVSNVILPQLVNIFLGCE